MNEQTCCELNSLGGPHELGCRHYPEPEVRRVPEEPGLTRLEDVLEQEPGFLYETLETEECHCSVEVLDAE